MKLAARDLAQLIAKPDTNRAGLLLFGADAMRVALKRQDFLKALVGPEAEAEMRLVRISASDLRSDPARPLDEMKAQGFFPGPRAVFIEEATEAVGSAILNALSDWQHGDAMLVVSAGALRASSKLRKGFETHSNAFAAAIYDDPMERAEIEDTLQKAGVTDIGREAMADLIALAGALDPGDFRQVIEKVALYKYHDSSPLAPDDIFAVAPATLEAAQDDLIRFVADGNTGAIGPLMVRLAGQGVTPISLCIVATRYFRQLYAASSDPKGPAAGVAELKPPVFWKVRDPMIKQVQIWGSDKLAQALGLLTETDLLLRSAQSPPQHAVIERAFIRLAMLMRRR